MVSSYMESGKMTKIAEKQLFKRKISALCKSQNTDQKIRRLSWGEAKNYGLEALMVKQIGSLDSKEIRSLKTVLPRESHLSGSMVAGLVAIGLVGLFIVGFSWLIGGF
jgi:uncharacterized protein with von Willebrand factor type A (vWA) domain